MRNSPLSIAFIGAFVLFLVAPILVICLVAFTPESYISIPTTSFSLRWFREVLADSRFMSAFGISTLLAAASATLGTLLSVPAALALARHRFAGRDAISAFLLSPLLIPHVVLGVALLKLLTDVGVRGSFAALILAHTVIVIPFSLRLVLAATVGLNASAENAAYSLGAGRFTVFRRLTVPMLIPGIVSGWVISFITSFDELSLSVFISSAGLMPLPVRLYAKIDDGIDPFVAAVSALLVLVAACAMLILDRIYGLERFFLGKA